MKKVRKKNLTPGEEIAGKLNRERVKVRLPPLPSHEWLRRKVGFAAEVEAEWATWYAVLDGLLVEAVGKLAAEADADQRELMKVAWHLVEVLPPETRGHPPLNPFMTFLRVEMEIRRGARDEQSACEEAGVDPKTFRTHRDAYPDMCARLKEVTTQDMQRFLEDPEGFAEPPVPPKRKK